MLKKENLYKFLIFTYINIAAFQAQAANFLNPTNQPISYIFVPGVISLETQTAKYIPEFTGSSGETILCNSGIHTLNEPISTCIFSDVNPQSLSNQSLNPFVYLGYWITDKQNKKYGVTIRKNQPLDQQQAAHQATSSFTLEKHAFDMTKLNLAQEADINILLKTYNDHMQKYPDSYLVLYGVSRGASTICTFMAKHQPQNIKAIILEAPFDSIAHFLKHSSKTSLLNNVLPLNKLLPKVTAYDPNGDSPIKSIEHISKEVPKLIVASELDDVIPVQCAKSLMRKFTNHGHKNAHLLILKKASHSGYAFDDFADKLKYETVVHAFYKHYGLPYDEALASQGADEWKKISGETTMMPAVS